MTAREFAVDVVRRLRQAGHEALFAGGCVRDQLLGLEPDDFDIATAAHPDQVQRLFPRTIAVGASFGVIEVLGPKPIKVQVATYRSDGPYSDSRRPDHVAYSDARADAARRDFTINGLFFDPLDGRLIDYVGGVVDLDAKVLRAIGEPAARFREDRLRLLRAVRFAARFELTIEPATWAAVRSMAKEESTVSGERIAEELRKLLVNANRVHGVGLLRDSGLLGVILPELLAAGPLETASHQPQSFPPSSNVRERVALARLIAPSFPLAFAVLCADVADASLGVAFARLRLANVERERIIWLIRHRAALADPAVAPLHVVKPLLSHPGSAELLALHHAFGHEAGADWCAARLHEWPAERLDPPPLLTGDDLIALGMAPGPRFKELLDAVRNAQLDERINTPDEALALIRS